MIKTKQQLLQPTATINSPIALKTTHLSVLHPICLTDKIMFEECQLKKALAMMLSMRNEMRLQNPRWRKGFARVRRENGWSHPGSLVDTNQG